MDLAYSAVRSIISWVFSIFKSAYRSLKILSLAARLMAREWTVTLSGASSFISSMVARTSFISSSGRPMIRSMLMLSKPNFLARRYFSFTISTVWRRPMRSRVDCFMVWGLMEILEIPWARRVFSLSSVMLSGRPASTVNSFTEERSNRSSIRVRMASSSSAFKAVGVPPPK